MIALLGSLGLLSHTMAIDLMVRHAPPESITDIEAFFSPVWKQDAGSIAGKPYTLDEIEHQIVRPMGEPQTPVALLCASESCPPLLREPWRGETLDAQFDGQLRIWLAHRDKGLCLDPANGTLYLSSIFGWFGDDFDARGGVLDFVTRYAPRKEAACLKAHGAETRILYLDYDWSLNAVVK
jgi:hypothetical protein